MSPPIGSGTDRHVLVVPRSVLTLPPRLSPWRSSGPRTATASWPQSSPAPSAGKHLARDPCKPLVLGAEPCSLSCCSGHIRAQEGRASALSLWGLAHKLSFISGTKPAVSAARGLPLSVPAGETESHVGTRPRTGGVAGERAGFACEGRVSLSLRLCCAVALAGPFRTVTVVTVDTGMLARVQLRRGCCLRVAAASRQRLVRSALGVLVTMSAISQHCAVLSQEMAVLVLTGCSACCADRLLTAPSPRS